MAEIHLHFNIKSTKHVVSSPRDLEKSQLMRETPTVVVNFIHKLLTLGSLPVVLFHRLRAVKYIPGADRFSSGKWSTYESVMLCQRLNEAKALDGHGKILYEGSSCLTVVGDR